MTEPKMFTMAIWTVKEGKVDEFIESWKTFAKATSMNKSAGGTAYLIRDSDNPQRLVGFGSWASEDEIRAWREGPIFKEFFSNARNLCDDLQFLTANIVASVRKEPIRA